MSLQSVTMGIGSGPYAYYRMNEASGTTLTDSSTSGLNGTYNTGVTVGGTAITNGDTYAPSFPGGSNTSYASTGVLNTNTNVTAANQTISLFIKTGTLTAGSFYDALGNGSLNSATYKGLAIYFKAGAAGTGYIECASYGTSNVSCDGPSIAIASNTLYHVVVVIDSVNNLNVLYLNGTAGTAGTYMVPAIPSASTSSRYVIGALPQQTTQNIPAIITEVSFWNIAWTASNVSSVYAAGIAANTVILANPSNSMRLLGLI